MIEHKFSWIMREPYATECRGRFYAIDNGQRKLLTEFNYLFPGELSDEQLEIEINNKKIQLFHDQNLFKT